MKKSINYSTIIIMLLSVSIVVMSVGFADFTEKLDINGTTNIKAATWNVGFDTTSYNESEGSVSVAESKRTLNGTTMTYDVTLNKPGDFYEFTIGINNYGTFNATLKGITLTELTEAQAKYLTYTVYYNDTPYTATNNNLTIALNSTQSATVKVRVEYIQPANANDLPQTAQKITLDASFNYIQAV